MTYIRSLHLSAINSLKRSVCATAVLFSTLFLPSQARGYEGDVHYGLTMWLAVKAGFQHHEAAAIARGNFRVDSGGPAAIDLLPDYGCAHPDPAASERVRRAHYPTLGGDTAARREVLSGSDVSKQAMVQVIRDSKGKESLMLSLFGAALHTYQDSWSHAGDPSNANAGRFLKCDKNLALSHSVVRGGPDSHDADLTYRYPDDAMRMAKASYEALMNFPMPPIGVGRKRSPWQELERELNSFVLAGTKLEKARWFKASGIDDVSFLNGISLPDGGKVELGSFSGRLLPRLEVNVSNQYDVSDEVRAFFDAGISSWLGSGDLEKVMPNYLVPSASDRNNVLARLKLLKMKDHGAADRIVHKSGLLSPRDLVEVRKLTKDPEVFIRATSLSEGLLPIVLKGKEVSPLLPYVTRELDKTNHGSRRVIAIMRLQHLPYDSVGWIAEKTGGGWKIIDIIITVDQ